MSEMTDRERFRATMHFRKADRLPFCDWFGCNIETILSALPTKTTCTIFTS
jgi:hypothetical protein